MTTSDPTRADATHSIDHEGAVKALTEALKTEELDEKDYQIRQALQLLTLKNE